MQPYDQFVEEGRPRFVRHIKSKYTLDDSSAEDVVQEAMIVGLQRERGGGFVDDDHRTFFHLQAAQCRAIDEIRRAKRQARTGAYQLLEHLPEPSELEIGEAQEFIAGYEVESIRAAVAELPEKLSEILFLSFYKGLTIDEIAGRLELTYGQVTSRKHRGLKRLAEILGEKTK